MTLLDDARRLAREIPMVPFGTHASGTCLFCRHDSRKEPPDEAHKPDCPWLSLPSIVAALECVYGLMTTEDGAEPIAVGGSDEGDEDVWQFCQRPADGPHWEGCLWVKVAYLVYGRQPR